MTGASLYLWLKAFHIVSFVAWMVGLLYLPRLFVYHADAKRGSKLSETFKMMERRLLKIIMLPALCATWILGLILAVMTDAFAQGWFHGKLLLVLLLSALHGYFVRCTREFAEDRSVKSARFFRLLNEFPTVLLILIVLLVVIRPF